MRSFHLLLTVILTILLQTSALILPRQSLPPPGDSLLQKIYQFPNNTWVENLAIRSNGNVLVSLISSPEIWQICPETQSAELVYTFPNAVSAMGIAEMREDIFVVSVGIFNYVTGAEEVGSWGVWEVDFAHSKSSGEVGKGRHGVGEEGHHERKARVRKVLGIPEAIFLNGATALPSQSESGLVLIADSGLGVIWRVDTHAGSYSIALEDPAFKANASAPRKIGVNGVHYYDGYIYSSNTFSTPILARTPISLEGWPTGPLEVFAESAEFAVNGGAYTDEFALDREGNVWLASASSVLVKIDKDGGQSVIAGGADSKVLLGGTSAAFGRTVETKDVLYVSTNGGLGNPPLGVVGGGLYWLDTAKL